MFHHACSVLPKLKVQDPFLPSVEISERVYNITDNIVAVFRRRTKQSFDRRIITIAAGFLAWQSCHYFDKNFNSKVPFKELIEPNKAGYFQKYLTLTNLDIDDVTANHIKMINRRKQQHISLKEICKAEAPKVIEVSEELEESEDNER